MFRAPPDRKAIGLEISAHRGKIRRCYRHVYGASDRLGRLQSAVATRVSRSSSEGSFSGASNFCGRLASSCEAARGSTFAALMLVRSKIAIDAGGHFAISNKSFAPATEAAPSFRGWRTRPCRGRAKRPRFPPSPRSSAMPAISTNSLGSGVAFAAAALRRPDWRERLVRYVHRDVPSTVGEL